MNFHTFLTLGYIIWIYRLSNIMLEDNQGPHGLFLYYTFSAFKYMISYW